MDPMNFTVCYYITGHGLGHATRSLGVIKSLLKRKYSVYIVSALEPSFFIQNITEEYNTEGNFVCEKRCLDTGAIQSDALTIDVKSSLEKYYNTIYTKRDELIAFEVDYLSRNSVNLVLSDATPLAFAAAAKAGILSVIVSNFTWDFIFSEMHKQLLVTESNNKYSEMVQSCSLDYSNCSLYALLPGSTPLPAAFTAANKIVNCPMYSRKATRSPSALRDDLGIPPEKNVVVISTSTKYL